MKIVAQGNVFNSIKNAIDKEARVTDLNMGLMEKMDYLLYNRIKDEVIEKLDMFDEKFTVFSEETRNVSMIELLVSNIIKDKFGDDVKQSDIDKLTQNAKMLPTEYFDENPYINNIILDGKEYEDLSLFTVEYPKFQVTEYSGDERKNLVFYPCWGFMRCDSINYVVKNTKTNKTPIIFPPSEMLQTQKYIDVASGKVLTLGLKIGYFVYLSGLKDDVSEITIIEADEQLIGFFNQHILPQFDEKTKSKIKIQKYDPIEYMKYLPDGEFDYCYVNLWGKHDDSEAYCKLMPIHNKFKKMKIDYYKEMRIVGGLYEIVVFNIYFALQQKMGSIEKDANFVENFAHELEPYKLKLVDDIFKDYKIKELNDLMNLFSFKFLLNKFNSIKYVEEV